MIWIILILSVGFIILLAYIFFIKIEIKNITHQLNDYNYNKSSKKIDITLFDRDIENLSISINKNIELSIQSKIKQKNIENEMKRAIANISHDLRTPLTSVIGYIQMIISRKLSNEKQIEYLHISLERAKSLQVLLSDFFNLSVIESPEYRLKIQPVNINNILCEAITVFYEDFVNNKIEPKVDILEENIIVEGNEIAIKRVIENLMNNVIKHSKKEVSICLKKENNKAVVIIINEAKNVIDSNVNLIFERFYKSDRSRTNSKNTGLGLSIAKSLMEKMNGKIYAQIHGDLLYIFCEWIMYK